MRMLALIAALAVSASYPEQVALAKQDYALRAAAGENPRYLDCGLHLPGHVREQTPVASNFWLPHLSLASVIEHQIGQELPGTNFLRIDVDLLGWGSKGWQDLAREYPYSLFDDPLIIRADWFLFITTDETKSDQYQKLLFRGNPPKNRADLLKALGIDKGDFVRATGIVIDKDHSGVAKDTRLVVHVPTGNGNHFETYDSQGVFGKSDPAENPEAAIKYRQGDTSGLQFQASEILSDVPKESQVTGERCAIQVAMLTDGKSNRIAEADTKIVEDYHKFKHVPSIRNPGSCIDCHKAWNGPNQSLFRTWIAKGVEITTTDRKTQQTIDSFHFSEWKRIIARGNEDHETYCHLSAGVKPAIAHAAFKSVIEFYDASLSPEQAAREVGAKNFDELQSALSYYSHRVGPVPKFGRFSSLGHVFPVSRTIWEGNIKKHEPGLYHHSSEAMKVWRGK